MTDVTTNRIHCLACFGVAAALLLVLAPTARSTAHDASAAAQTRCAEGSVAAVIGGERTCLEAGERCKHALDRQYHRYGFHCHTGRLTRSKPKPPEVFSRMVDVGGFRLAIHCRGRGSPTIVLESGAGASSFAWFVIEPTLAKTTRVCSYDRAGLGHSDARRPAHLEQPPKTIEELHALLAGAGISPPYVLGGWSIGGFFNRLYTKRYPSEVRGLVSVDGTPWGLPGEPFLDPPAPDLFVEAAAELAASSDLGDRPLVVLTASMWPTEWLKWVKQIALLSSSSILVRADFAGHAIQMQRPDLTEEAFRLVVAAVRNRAPLPSCNATRLPTLIGTCLDPTSSG